ncbi:MAG: NHL repeat-containing protein [Chitinivibrionia bacterium]|nr:NHL repeat-containing protein [Chitinivibrionia bacterium]
MFRESSNRHTYTPPFFPEKRIPRTQFRSCVLACGVLMLVMLARPPRSPADERDTPTTLVPPPWSHCYGLNRVHQTHLDFYSGYRKKFASPRGIAAVKLACNDSPAARDDDELTVYGVNAGTSELIYNTSLLSVAFFGSRGSGDGQFRDATGIAAAREGLVVVADTGNDRIVFLENIENNLRYRSAATLNGTACPLRAPRGVAVERDSIYVADSGNNRIVVMSASGSFMHDIKGSMPLEEPFGIAVISASDWNHYGSRFIIVTDSLNQRMLRLSLDGRVEESARLSEITDKRGGFFFPAVDYYSNVYASDTVAGCLYKFDKSLQFLTGPNCTPDWDIRLDEPRGLAIYRRFGQMFVAERSGATYFWIGTDVLNLDCRGEASGRSISLHTRFLLTEHSKVSISLETDEGDVVEVFVENQFMEPGRISRVFFVDRERLSRGGAKCKYILAVTAKPTYASRKYVTVMKKAPVRNL